MTMNLAAAESLECRTLLSGPLPTASQATSFFGGPMIADREQNLVYIAASDKRILSVDTESARTIASVKLKSRAYGFAISLDDQRLFVLEEQVIDVFALPALSWVSKFSIPEYLDSIAAGANNRLYGAADSGKLLQLDASTGAVVNSLNAVFPYGGSPYDGGKVLANSDGTRLFVKAAQNVEPHGPMGVDEYDIGGSGAPTFVKHLFISSRAGNIRATGSTAGLCCQNIPGSNRFLTLTT